MPSVEKASMAVRNAKYAYCKFLSANDTGITGGHQSGILISKKAYPILFQTPGSKGENLRKKVTIDWDDWKVTESNILYYGKRTRNEYRITTFGRGFPFFDPEYTGSLFVLAQNSPENYQAFVFNHEDDIDEFLSNFGLSASDTNKLIGVTSSSNQETEEFRNFINQLTEEFPSSMVMSKTAREIHNRVYNRIELIRDNPDQKLLDWTEIEYRLFREIENARYGERILNGFGTIEDFVFIANKVLNRRKARAGKSLEHHLAALFAGNDLQFDEQVKTELNKRPDFVFPSAEAYNDLDYPTENLVVLAAKTTCKDRWRQILNEANRVKDEQKFLCTLQQGISPRQMDEMHDEKVTLVVPKPYIKAYPPEKRNRIWTLAKFIAFVKERERFGY